MCITCYREAGSPKPSAEALAVSRLFEDVSEDGETSSFYCVSDNMNVEDDILDACIADPELRPEERIALVALRTLPEVQRYAALAFTWGDIDEHGAETGYPTFIRKGAR